MSAADLAEAVRRVGEWGSSLGEVLIGISAVRPFEFYRSVAEIKGLPFVNLLAAPPEPALLRMDDRDAYSRLQLIPWRQSDGRCALAVVDAGDAQIAWAEARYGAGRFEFVVTSPYDIDWHVQRAFRDADSLRAREALHRWQPEHSAKVTLTRGQRIALIASAAAYLVFLVGWPRACLIASMAAATLLYTVTFLFKFLLTYVGSSRRVDAGMSPQSIAELTDPELPIYTVLVPMFREARVLPLLMNALRRLDYPASKLDVKLVLEEDDEETIEAAKALKLPGTVEIVRVPASHPKTKPKACNYALLFARGELVTIYDAEDQPEPDQLKKAVAAFKHGGERLACVQARLNYFNRGENWLTRMFTLEYSQWFDFLLPGLYALNMPIPLGGTSNHFRMSVLRKVHAWDPYNVTEDADLGIRLAQEGYEIGVIASTTYEEANGVLPSWVRQRSRWVKGYMQTWLVHMRHPIDLWRSIGAKGVFCFHFFIGAPPLIMLMNPVMWTITVLFFLLGDTRYGWLFPEPVGTLATFNLVFANLLLVYFGVIAALKRRYLDLVVPSVLQPLYWVLHSIAAYKALIQLVRNPHYWEKTEHGTSTVTQAQLEHGEKAAA